MQSLEWKIHPRVTTSKVAHANSMSLAEFDNLPELDRAEAVALHLIQRRIDDVANALMRDKGGGGSVDIPSDFE